MTDRDSWPEAPQLVDSPGDEESDRDEVSEAPEDREEEAPAAEEPAADGLVAADPAGDGRSVPPGLRPVPGARQCRVG